MVRLTFRGAIGVLSAALAAACLGGQTGQPSSASCGSAELSSPAAWADTTVGAAAEAFAGAYEAPLLWRDEPRTASAPTPIDLQDRLQLTIAYDGARATRDCEGRLHVPVTVTVTTSESGIAESGGATLDLSRSMGVLAGHLSYDSDRVALDAALAEVAAGVSIAGGFDALDPELPGASASFAVEP
ncbi:MAG TPA: hypothetical protein VJN18_22370 [Polyangiaceae bacterium]|nr:hypothetical protein [Polyangiaceae bacterium]